MVFDDCECNRCKRERRRSEAAEKGEQLPTNLFEALAQGWKVKPSTDADLERALAAAAAHDRRERQLSQSRGSP